VLESKQEGALAQAPAKSWFGLGRKPRLVKPSAKEGYRMHAEDIAKRYGDKSV
jgi:hypothetical protein